jgi:hypothetical protein
MELVWVLGATYDDANPVSGMKLWVPKPCWCAATVGFGERARCFGFPL